MHVREPKRAANDNRINGAKIVTNSGDWTTSWASNSSIRWSTGIYFTGWYQNLPSGQGDLSIYHDQLRVATPYSLADPANWNREAIASD